MVKKLLFIFIAAAFLFTMLPAPSYAAADRAAADGSFIQWWLVKDWSDERWTNECNSLKEAGMHYLILAPTAFYSYNEETKTGVTKTIYPTSLEGFEVLKDDNGVTYPDVVDACLRNAQKAGIKVILGLNFSDDWWENQYDPAWVNARMEEGNKVADELWSRYHDKYSDTIYGWYWCWEVDNVNFKKSDSYNSMQILTDAIKIHMNHFDNAGMHLPFMLSPFMTGWGGTPQEYAEMWEYVFSNSGMKEGDIFCPQDCIGAGGLNMSNYVQWFEALRKAVDTKPGLKFWSDNETFVAYDWTGATLDRFVKQLTDLQPYVDNYVTFAYSHYYSPFNTDPGFQKTYLDYLNTGSLETTPPTSPTNFNAVLRSTGDVSLSWDAATDNLGVCGYYILRDGKKIANKQVPRIDGGKNTPSPLTSLVDAVLKSNTTYTYEVQAYDFAGNTSAKSSPLIITTGEFQYLPNNISKGRLYKVTPAAHKNYPDTESKELTDGIYANPTDIFDPAWQGWFNNSREVIVGLVENRPVQQFVIGYLRDPGPTIVLPAKISVSISDNGTDYTKVGDFPSPNVPVDDPAGRFSYCLTLDQPVNAKYVKFESFPGGGWTFVDEVEIRNNGDQYNNDEIVNDPNDPVLSEGNSNPGNDGKDLSNKISTGCSYTVTPAADANYPDTGTSELTDNTYGDATDPYDQAWQNWWHAGSEPTIAVMDLGSLKKVEQVTASFMKLASWGIQLPNSINVYASPDGIDYENLGPVQITSNAGDNVNIKLRLTLPAPVQARYIKLVIDTGGSSVLADEIEVRNNDTSDVTAPVTSVSITSMDWINQDITVTPSYSDDGGSGIAASQYSWSNSETTPGTWINYEGSNIVQNSGGIWYLYLRAVDNAGNEAVSKYGPYKIDKEAAEIIEHFTNKYIYGTALKLDYESIDTLSGIKESHITLFGKTFNNGESVLLDTPGSYIIEITATDNAGNVKILEKQIDIIVPAKVDIYPDTVNSKSGGDIMVYIELPGDLKVEDINLESLSVNNTILPVTDAKYGYVKNPVSDYDKDGRSEFMVKFSKEALIKELVNGLNNITISGSTGTYQFTYSGSIRIINK